MCTKMFTSRYPMILASGSPRRQDFLCALGLAFEVDTAGVAEPKPHKEEDAVAYVCRASRAKTLPVAVRHPGACIIGADTVVVSKGEIMGKPMSDAQALAMLTRLAGSVHQVVSACCIVLPQQADPIFLHASAMVHMPPWDTRTLQSYIATGESSDKAGAYAIQGVGAFLVSHIEGAWTTVVGLPLAEVVEVLTGRGVIAPV